MSNDGPSTKEMIDLVGKHLYELWAKLCNLIDERYDVDHIWNYLGKDWLYEYKYHRGGKTLCTFYAKANAAGFMVILGKNERETFEKEREDYSKAFQKVYDESKTYHDGKWMMFELDDTTMFNDFIKVLKVKRKPNKKNTT